MLQTFVKPRAGRGLKQANHRRHDPAFLNEINLPLKDGGCVTVKTDDKASLHLQAGSLDALHIFDQVAVHVLLLATFGQAILIRCLDSDKDLVEPRFDHHAHQLLIVDQIDGRFCVKRYPQFVFPPFDQGGQQLGLETFLVPNEVVVHEKDARTPPQVIENVQFGHDLLGCLGAWSVTQ